MKKRLFLLPLCACMLCSCGPTQGTQEEKKEPDPVIPTKTLTGIEITNPPTTVNYKEGETFNPSGMVVNAVYDDGTKEVVTNYQIPNQALTVGMTSITITYNGKTAQVNITVTAVPKYTVTFMANATDKIADVIYKEGETPSYSYSIPSTPQYEYTVLGWSLTPNGEVLGTLPEVTQNATYYAVVSQKTRKYAVIFKDPNGSVIETKNLEYGSSIVAPSYTPQDTAQYDYELIGWSLSQGGTKIESFPTVTGEVTFFALVSSTVRKYTVTFFDIDGKQYQSGSLEYGSTPTCDYEVEDTAEWDYTTKWSKTAGGTALASLPKVTENANYYAVTTRVKQKYDISFKNEDGTDYKKVNVEYGVVPTVTAPSKDADQQYTYTFAGWSTTKGGEVLASLPVVTGEATYYAIFGKTVNKYNLKLVYDSGESDVVLNVEYGTVYENLNSYIPEIDDDMKFSGWYLDSSFKTKVTFPLTIEEDTTIYSHVVEKVDMSDLLKNLLGLVDANPYSFIPEEMRPTYEDNFVQASDVLNFETVQNVSDIKKQGFGEQWEMVIDNLNQSERFHQVFRYGDNAITGLLNLLVTHFTENEDDRAADVTDESKTISAHAEYKEGVLTSAFTFNKGITLPVFGEVKPEIVLSYTPLINSKTVQIKINDNNKLLCTYSDEVYGFAIKYGIDDVIRSAICELDKQDDDSIQGLFFEFITLKDKSLVSSAAEFVINDDFVSVVGNKASGLVGFKGYINELYDVSNGHLLGYKVQEKLSDSIPIIGGKTYYTFFFNLWDIDNITTVKAVSNGVVDPSKNPHDVYLNGQEDKFAVPRNGFVASRKYDCEMRKHYYYGVDEDGNLVKYETEVPMMFIQDDTIIDTDDDGYTNFSDFPDDMKSKSKISGAKVNDDVMTNIVPKLRSDHSTLIPKFIEDKELATPEIIDNILDF